MDLFETHSIINEGTFKELKKHLIPRGFRIFFITFITLSACLFIVGALIRYYVLMMAMPILIIAVVLDYIWTLNKNVKINIKRLQETVHAKECEYTTSFSDTGFKIINHATNAMATIAYDDINRFIETETYYVLFTKANQFGLVNKSDTDSTNKREELINFLKQRCKKIRRLRFDNLNGDTPLQRLTAWLRRRNIRILALFTALILAICVEIFILLYISRLDGDTDSLLAALVILSFMVLIYLPVLFWLVILVFRPDKSYGMRRLKRLGSLEKIAGELEEDLAAEGGVLFQRGSLRVTRRFIIEANLFCFRVYPLEGLHEFDCQTTLFLPAFHYENGTSIKMVTRVPFRMLRPYIGSEVKVNMGIEKPESAINMRTEKPKLRKKDIIIGLAVFLCITGVLLYLLCFKLSVWGTRAAAVCICGVLLWLLEVAVHAAMKDRRLTLMLSEIKDPGELIRKMEELYAEGWYKNQALYLNQLSTVYYDKQDFKKALELVREAHSIQSGKRESRVGSGMTLSEMLRLNEISYLIALERLDEAEPLLAPLDDKRYKSPVASYLINANRAQLAIEKGDTKAAREYLRRVSGLPAKGLTEERRVNVSCHLLLLEAECDLLEQDTASALAKLDDVLARSTWQPNVKRTAELKESARRKSNGLRRRRHGFRTYQAGRRPAPKYAAAGRQARRRAERNRAAKK